MEAAKVKSVVQGLVKSNPFERVRLVELEALFFRVENQSLMNFARNNGFPFLSEMFKSWPGFIVSGSGLSTSVAFQEVAPVEIIEQTKSRSPVEHSTEHLSSLSLNPPVLQSLSIIKEIDKVVPQFQPIMNVQKPVQIVLLHIVNPHRFWFCEYEEHKVLCVLINNMTDLYNERTTELMIEQNHLKPGLYIAVKCDQMWYRAMIVKLLKPGQARVFYVDRGFVEDVSVDVRVRYLMESFSLMPSAAHRGVLSYVQPKKGIWNIDSINFMKKRSKMNLQAKVFRRNHSDFAYHLAIRINSNGEQKNLADKLIEIGSCCFDASFLEKTVCTSKHDFSYYENGLHLDEPQQTENDDWLPKASPEKKRFQNRKVIHQVKQFSNNSERKSNASQSSASRFRLPVSSKVNQPVSLFPKLDPLSVSSRTRRFSPPLKVPTFSQANPVVSATTATTEKIKIGQGNPILLSTSTVENKTQSPTKVTFDPRVQTDRPKPKRFAAQDLEKLPIGSVKLVLIHVINHVKDFYFYFKDDLKPTYELLEELNIFFGGENLVPNEEFSIETAVIVYSDENYCRGRITEVLANGSVFMIFLIDFGMVIERAREEIYQLIGWYQFYAPAAYHGQLANIPEHIFLKTVDDLKARVFEKLENPQLDGQFIKAQLIRIVDDKVELRLMS